MSKHVGLAAFQQHLNRRLAEVQAREVRHAFLGLSAGNERWLVDIADARELLPVTDIVHVPLTQRWFRGLVAVRGDLLGVIDIGCCITGMSTPLSPRARILLPQPKFGIEVALLFSESLGLRDPHDFAYLETADLEGITVERWQDSESRRWGRFDMARFAGDPRFADAANE